MTLTRHNVNHGLWRGRRLALVILMAFFGSVNAVSINGQDEESFEGVVTGIRANAIKGAVFYQRNEGKFELETGLKLEEGDFIRTEANAYAEMILQPGNYLRVGEDSELQIFSDAYDRIRLKLNRGSMSFEILARDGEAAWSFYESLSQRRELIRVMTPNAVVFVTQSGIFRVNAKDGLTELIVRKGEAALNGQRVKEKRKAIASLNGLTVAELESKTEDAFDLWGRERAEKSVQANRALKQEAPWSKRRKEGDEPSVNLAEDEEQSTSPYVVSAKPGTVNFVESGVDLGGPTREWAQLMEKSDIERGDHVRTSKHSFVELTILPDINLRLDGGSEVRFEELSHETISLKLLRGAAILDVARFDRKQVLPITLAGSSTSVVIAERGNYRIDVSPSGDRVIVRDGKVIYKEKSVGSCKEIVNGYVSDCDKKRTDSFDYWSEHRGEGEIVRGRAVFVMVSYLSRLRRYRSRNTGFWFQNPGQTNYAFVPFFSANFRSPYGGEYTTILSPRRRWVTTDGPTLVPRRP